MDIEMMYNLQSQTAVIIGGARDLGYDMLDILAQAGCAVALTSRTLQNAQATAQKIQAAYNCDVLPAQLDVTDHA